MRFAVHRPGYPEASPRSHGMPCRDVPGCVYVSVAGELAGYAGEERLALAVLRTHRPTRRASLRGVGRTYSFYSPGRLVPEAPPEHSPAAGKYLAVESRLRRDIVPRLANSALGGSHHVANLQVLEANDIEAARDSRRRLLAPGFPRISLPGVHTRDGRLHPSTAVRTSLGARQPSLQSREPLLPLGAEAGSGQQLASRKGRRHNDASVDANDRAVAWSTDRSRNRCECDMPTVRSIKGDAVGLRVTRDGLRPTEPNPSGLRHPDLAHAAGQPPDTLRLRTYDPEALVPSGLVPGGLAVGPLEKMAHGLSEVPKGLLLNGLRTGSQPSKLPAGFSQLAALSREARPGSTARSPMVRLLNCHVPDETRMRAVEPHDLVLPMVRSEPVTDHKSNVLTTTDIPEGVTRPPFPALRAGLRTPRYQ